MSTTGPTVELPYELQRIIFDHAARLDRRCACNLLQVARYINEWILPILYEDVILKDHVDASNFIQIKQKYLLEQSVPKSLTLSLHVPFNIAERLLSYLCRNLSTLTIFRDSTTNEASLFPFIPPSTRRLAFITPFKMPLITSQSTTDPTEFPYTLLPSLTHIVLVPNSLTDRISFDHCLGIAEALGANDSRLLAELNVPASTINPFLNLCYLAVSVSFRNIYRKIQSHAPRLKCFAVLLSKNHTARLKQIMTEVKCQQDPRIVVVRQYGDFCDWKRTLKDGFTTSDFWFMVENLARKRYICDDGEQWDESIVNQFRLNHPDISLLDSD